MLKYKFNLLREKKLRDPVSLPPLTSYSQPDLLNQEIT